MLSNPRLGLPIQSVLIEISVWGEPCRTSFLRWEVLFSSSMTDTSLEGLKCERCKVLLLIKLPRNEKYCFTMKISYLPEVHLGFVATQGWWDHSWFCVPESGADFETFYTSNLPSHVLWLAQSPLHQFVMQFTQLEQMSPQTFVVSNKAFPLAATCWSLSLSLMLADSSYF